jgi:orotidine-5'-phosphate decarboxylase
VPLKFIKMTRQQLVHQIKTKKSFLCIGLDVDLEKIPSHLLQFEDPIFEFNKLIIDATHDLAVAYKPNIAFYEAYGLKGWQSLQKTIDYLNQNYSEIFTIADAKRGDIGNTSMRYAKTYFKDLNFDAMTVAPYMGSDSVEPFLNFKNKFTVLLALTSNIGSTDFQTLSFENITLYESVIKKSLSWKNAENLMFVVGATRPEHFKSIRNIIPDHFILVPGVGAQGGSLKDVCQFGLNKDVGLLVNASRSIIYASNDVSFDQNARKKALELQQEMSSIIDSSNL